MHTCMNRSHSVKFRESAPSNPALISGGSVYTETETENQCAYKLCLFVTKKQLVHIYGHHYARELRDSQCTVLYMQTINFDTQFT